MPTNPARDFDILALAEDVSAGRRSLDNVIDQIAVGTPDDRARRAAVADLQDTVRALAAVRGHAAATASAGVEPVGPGRRPGGRAHDVSAAGPVPGRRLRSGRRGRGRVHGDRRCSRGCADPRFPAADDGRPEREPARRRGCEQPRRVGRGGFVGQPERGSAASSVSSPTAGAAGSPVASAAWTPDAPRFVLWTRTDTAVTLWQWDPASGAGLRKWLAIETWSIPYSPNDGVTVLVSPDASRIAVVEHAFGDPASHDRTRVFDASGRVLWTSPADQPETIDLAWSIDGTMLALGAIPAPWTVVTFGPNGTADAATYNLTADGAYRLLAFSADDARLVGYETSGEAAFWDKPVALDLADGTVAPLETWPAGMDTNATGPVQQINPDGGSVIAQPGRAKGTPDRVIRSASGDQPLNLDPGAQVQWSSADAIDWVVMNGPPQTGHSPRPRRRPRSGRVLLPTPPAARTWPLLPRGPGDYGTLVSSHGAVAVVALRVQATYPGGDPGWRDFTAVDLRHAGRSPRSRRRAADRSERDCGLPAGSAPRPDRRHHRLAVAVGPEPIAFGHASTVGRLGLSGSDDGSLRFRGRDRRCSRRRVLVDGRRPGQAHGVALVPVARARSHRSPRHRHLDQWHVLDAGRRLPGRPPHRGDRVRRPDLWPEPDAGARQPGTAPVDVPRRRRSDARHGLVARRHQARARRGPEPVDGAGLHPERTGGFEDLRRGRRPGRLPHRRLRARRRPPHRLRLVRRGRIRGQHRLAGPRPGGPVVFTPLTAFPAGMASNGTTSRLLDRINDATGDALTLANDATAPDWVLRHNGSDASFGLGISNDLVWADDETIAIVGPASPSVPGSASASPGTDLGISVTSGPTAERRQVMAFPGLSIPSGQGAVPTNRSAHEAATSSCTWALRPAASGTVRPGRRRSCS